MGGDNVNDNELKSLIKDITVEIAKRANLQYYYGNVRKAKALSDNLLALHELSDLI